MTRTRQLARGLVTLALATPLLAKAAPPGDASRGGHLAAATGLSVKFDRQQAAAGDARPVTVTIHAFDAAGRPRDVDLGLDDELGALAPAVHVATGVWRALLTVPPYLAGKHSLVVTAHSGELSASASLALVAGPAATLDVAAPSELTADGRSEAWVAVMASDANGNPAEPSRLGAEAERGGLGAPRADGPGRWILAYKPREVARDMDDRILVRADGIERSRTVRLLAPVSTLQLGAKGGLAARVHGGLGPAIAAEASTWTRAGGHGLGLVLTGTWWTFSDASSSPAATFHTTSSYLSLSVEPAIRLPLGSRATLTASAGGGTARAASTASIPAQPDLSEARWVPLATAGLSISTRALGGAPFAELRASWVGDPGLANLRGAAAPVFLSVGYRFDVR